MLLSHSDSGDHMGFFGSLFGDKIENENKTKAIFECKTHEEQGIGLPALGHGTRCHVQ
jgi:hypothetical protein